MKYLTYESALGGIKSVFSKTDSDLVSLEDIFSFWGRGDYTLLQNQRWFGNKLVHWKYHNLVTPVYRLRNKKRVLFGVQLTLKGKRALGKLLDESDEVGNNGNADLAKLMKSITDLRKKSPEFEITFDVKLKKQNSVSG